MYVGFMCHQAREKVLIELLNIEASYPTHKERVMQSLNEDRCKEIIEKTEGLHRWIKQQLSDT